uniref:SCP domain-containing protein n=1 Tax=Mesocestoides corti TaxID=53468 RepID=A0A5K3F9U9_MESCO
YSVGLEKLAKKWLSNCTYVVPSASLHPEFEDVVVNLQSGTKPQDASFEPASRFDHQKEAYNYETNTCPTLCGNYRRIIWSTSSQVGCYRRRCDHSDFWVTPRYVMACLYKPGHRNRQERPYERGSSCSGCPPGLGCYRNQCTALTKPGVVRVPLEKSVIRESAAVKRQIIPTPEATSSMKMQIIPTQKMSSPTKKSFIRTQKKLSPTEKSLLLPKTITSPEEEPSIEVPAVITGTEGSSSLTEAAPDEAGQTRPTTSFSTHLSAVSVLMFANMAMIFV